MGRSEHLDRISEVATEGWMVKGGAALLLRLDPNRTANDVDRVRCRPGTSPSRGER